MQKLSPFILADAGKCSGCRACELACSASHEAAAPFTVGSMAETVTPRLFLTKSGAIQMPVQCHHCEDAPCVSVCVENALYRAEDGAVAVHGRRCIGCKNCALACPFGAISIMDAAFCKDAPVPASKGSVLKCDLCQDRSGGPACVAACPNEALSPVEADSLLAQKRASAVEANAV